MATKKIAKRDLIEHGWHALQDALMECETSEQVLKIMEHEKQGRARLRWLLRIQGRLAALRSAEEVAELRTLAKE